MKRILVAAFAFSSALSLSAQSAFVIKGTTGGLIEGKKVYLIQPDISVTPTDSMVVTQGAFTFQGQVAQPMFAYLAAEGGGGVNFVLEPGEIHVALNNGKMGGTPLNEKWNAYIEETAPFNQKMYDIQKEAAGLTPADSVRRMELQKEMYAVYAEVEAVSKKFILNNLDNILPAPLVKQFMRGFTPQEKEQVFTQASPALKQNEIFRRLLLEKEGAANQQVGKRYTDFTMQDEKGQKVSLSDYAGKGKYVLLDFWASWCGPCRHEMPTLKAVYEKYKAKGLEIVGVSLDNKKEAWTKAITEWGLTWPQMSDLRSVESIAALAYGVKGIPCILLIGPDGTIVANGLRGNKIDETLSKFLK